jgi:hypothetical protein
MHQRKEFCTHNVNSGRRRGKYMKRLGLVALASILGVVFSGSMAMAVVNFDNAPSGAHFRKGFGEPVCTETTVPTTGAVTVSCTGTEIAGVGNTNANLSLTVTGTADFVCHNPGNDDIVEPHSASVSETTDTLLIPSRNGTIVVPASSGTITPDEASRAFSCPNPNWREEFVGFSDVTFTYRLTFVGFDAPAILITG